MTPIVCNSCWWDYAFNLPEKRRRSIPAAPRTPVPSRISEEGSGVADVIGTVLLMMNVVFPFVFVLKSKEPIVGVRPDTEYVPVPFTSSEAPVLAIAFAGRYVADVTESMRNEISGLVPDCVVNSVVPAPLRYVKLVRFS